MWGGVGVGRVTVHHRDTILPYFKKKIETTNHKHYTSTQANHIKLKGNSNKLFELKKISDRQLFNVQVSKQHESANNVPKLQAQK